MKTNYKEITRQQDEIFEWLAETEWTAFGTLKFTNGHDIGISTAEECLKKFLNKLDKTYLGDTLVAAGHRIERAVFRQLGSSGSNLHYHFLARPDADVQRFCETARCVWDETSSHTMGFEHTWISPVRNHNDAVRYGLHEYKTLGADTLCLTTTCLAQSYPKVRPIHRLRRLLRRHDANEATREMALMRAALAKRRAQ